MSYCYQCGGEDERHYPQCPSLGPRLKKSSCTACDFSAPADGILCGNCENKQAGVATEGAPAPAAHDPLPAEGGRCGMCGRVVTYRESAWAADQEKFCGAETYADGAGLQCAERRIELLEERIRSEFQIGFRAGYAASNSDRKGEARRLHNFEVLLPLGENSK